MSDPAESRVSENRRTDDPTCPLCVADRGVSFYIDRRDYFRCPNCQLVYVLPAQFLSAEEEKAAYDQHQNSPDDLQYRQFLSRLFEPLHAQLAAGSSGLDFGSGPGPTLSVMFAEAGYAMQIYDPFYAPDESLFQRQYDFITASEVVEHLHRPRMELDRLWTCLRPGGWLGLMTKRVIDADRFAHWHYRNDPTHVCFYALQSFEWLAAHWGARLIVPGDDVVLLQKRV